MSKQKYPQAASVTSSGDSPRRTLNVKKNGYTQVKNHAKQDRKRAEAFQRQDIYDGKTLKQQLQSCDPNGSKRQRTRIEKAMATAVSEPVKVVKQPKGITAVHA